MASTWPEPSLPTRPRQPDSDCEIAHRRSPKQRARTCQSQTTRIRQLSDVNGANPSKLYPPRGGTRRVRNCGRGTLLTLADHGTNRRASIERTREKPWRRGWCFLGVGTNTARRPIPHAAANRAMRPMTRAGNACTSRRVYRPRFCRFTLLACLPSAVRVFFGSLEIVLFRLAADAAFFTFRRAAALCFADAMGGV